MKDHFLSKNAKAFLVSGFVSASMCFAVTVLALRDSSRASRIITGEHSSSSVAQSAMKSVPGSGGTVAHLDVEVITLRPAGFERAQITRPRGLFGIAVENRSGLSDLELRLDRQGGARLNQAQLSRGKAHWKLTLDLLPGRYVLTEANHPEWSCGITISEK